MSSIRNTLGGLILTVGLAGAVFAHPDSGVTLFAPHIQSPITIDGDVSDWVSWFPEAAVITFDQTFAHVCGENCEPNAEDFDWTTRIAWDDATNRIYFSIEVFDDVWIIPEAAGERSLHRWDDLELVVDAEKLNSRLNTAVSPSSPVENNTLSSSLRCDTALLMSSIASRSCVV